MPSSPSKGTNTEMHEEFPYDVKHAYFPTKMSSFVKKSVVSNTAEPVVDPSGFTLRQNELLLVNYIR
jgi:hypothetical protein